MVCQNEDAGRASRPNAWWLAALFGLVSLWPALVSGGALWFDDLSPYVKGGHAAVETVFGAADTPTGQETLLGGAAASGGLAGGVAAPVSGVRSVAYSVFAYLAAMPAPGFWALAVLQAGALGGMLALFVRRERGPVWLYATVLALGTGPVAASTASPDLWAGLLLLGVLLFVRHRARLSPLALGFVGVCVAFAVAAHASHLLLGAALALFVWAWPRLTGTKPRGGALLLGAVALGMAGVVGTSLIGFGEASLAPKRYPIVLARAIEDGPALWHLEEHCDEYRYAVCEVFPGPIPANVGSFLWEEGGLRDLATPTQMDRVRAEEGTIIRRALAEYPFFQARRAVANFAAQASMVAAPPRLGLTAAWAGGGEAHQRGTLLAPPAERLLVLAQGVSFALVLVSIAGLLVLRYARPDASTSRLLAVAAAGFLANAAICGVLSVPALRYQARIAWVMPLVGIAALAATGTAPRARAQRYVAPGGLDAG